MAIVVFGGSGLLGKATAERIAAEHGSVICADIDTSVDFDSPEITSYRCDITDARSVSVLLDEASPEAVINLAYVIGGDVHERPGAAVRVNLIGMENVFRAAAEQGVERVVWGSSVGVYGAQRLYPESATVTEESVPPAAFTATRDISYYSAMKHLNEYQARLYAERTDLDIVTVRPSTVFGPRRESGFRWLGSIVETSLEGGRTTIPYGPDEVLPLVYVDDVATLFSTIALADSPRFDVYNSGGHPVTIRAFADLIESAVGGTVTWDDDGGTLSAVADISNERAVEEFGFHLTPLADALEDYVGRVA